MIIQGKEKLTDEEEDKIDDEEDKIDDLDDLLRLERERERTTKIAPLDTVRTRCRVHISRYTKLLLYLSLSDL